MSKHNNIPDGLTPFRIAITETYVIEVEVYAKDSKSAVALAEQLRSDGEIDFDPDHYAEGSIECRGVSRPIDLQLHQVFGLEQNELSVVKPSLDEKMTAAVVKAGQDSELDMKNGPVGPGRR